MSLGSKIVVTFCKYKIVQLLSYYAYSKLIAVFTPIHIKYGHQNDEVLEPRSNQLIDESKANGRTANKLIAVTRCVS